MPTQEIQEAMSEKLQSNLRQFAFELNDENTWGKVIQSYYDLLNDDISVESYVVKCDDENNTPERIAARELWVDVAIRHNGENQYLHYGLRLTAESMNLALAGPSEETGSVEGDSN